MCVSQRLANFPNWNSCDSHRIVREAGLQLTNRYTTWVPLSECEVCFGMFGSRSDAGRVASFSSSSFAVCCSGGHDDLVDGSRSQCCRQPSVKVTVGWPQLVIGGVL